MGTITIDKGQQR